MMKKSTMLPLLAAAVSLFLTGCEGKLVEQVDLIPQAQSVTIKNGSFSLAGLRTMQAPAEWTENAQTFAGLLQKSAGISLTVSDIDAPLSLVKNDQLGNQPCAGNPPSAYPDRQRKQTARTEHPGQATFRLPRTDAGL